ncbi:MAG: WG repeat-containing protein [Raineya sp.]|jgi:hypothetical protein|nr:WG repeat-containing protein [Raineya sp.]
MKKIILTFAFISIITASFAQTQIFQENGKFGVNRRGKKILKAKYEEIKPDTDYFVEEKDEDKHFVAVKQKGKWGFFNLKGKEITPTMYEDYESYMFRGGLAGVKLNGKWGFIDTKGKEVIPFQYEEVNGFFEKDEYNAVKLNGKWGFIDTKGKEVIPFQYERAINFFRENTACIKMEGKWGTIDRTGKIVISPKYDEKFTFISGVASVKRSGRQFYINTSEEEVSGYPNSNSGYNSNNNNSSNTNSSSEKKPSGKVSTWKCGRCGDIKLSENSYGPVVGSGGCRYVDKNGIKQNGSHKYVKQ